MNKPGAGSGGEPLPGMKLYPDRGPKEQQ